MTFYEAVEELKQKLYELFVEPISTEVLQFLRDENQIGGGHASDSRKRLHQSHNLTVQKN
ncbi:hypothetical protein ACS6XX_05280 [Streptococcus suis]